MDVKKKRGRKPKNSILEEHITEHVENKKRGRKKKYEIENSERILHRNSEDNFNHHIIYSDDENGCTDDKCVKKISFGNLDITVSKKIDTENINDFKLKTRNANITINQDEYSSDEDKEVPVESFMNCNEKNFQESKRYVPKIVSECSTSTNEFLKNIKVITTTKDQIKCSTEWPDSCDICCWWCCHKFGGTPCTLPVKYDSLRKRFTFAGIFCSWGCVKAYNFDRADHKKYECSALITVLIQQLVGLSKAIRIKPAPPRQALKMFGGYLDIDDFRNRDDVDQYNINLVKFNYIHPEVSEIKNIKSKQEKSNYRLSRPT
jgi:hypothetical protein